jgi:hypothetical protein
MGQNHLSGMAQGRVVERDRSVAIKDRQSP